MTSSQIRSIVASMEEGVPQSIKLSKPEAAQFRRIAAESKAFNIFLSIKNIIQGQYIMVIKPYKEDMPMDIEGYKERFDLDGTASI